MATKSDITHDDLCKAGAKWLLGWVPVANSLGNAIRYKGDVVLKEMVTVCPETPDVIGWFGGLTILLEAKCSRSDFKADSIKPFRLCPSLGMGAYRYYITPPGLLAAHEIPDNWGLVEWNGERMRIVKLAPWNEERSVAHETKMLISTIKRLPPGTEAVSANYFVHKHSNWTDVHVVLDQEPQVQCDHAFNVTSPNSCSGARCPHREPHNPTFDCERTSSHCVEAGSMVGCKPVVEP